MKTSISEIADRYSILRLKSERILTENLKDELALYKSELDFYINETIYRYTNEYIYSYVNRLYDVNGKIWDLESDIRKGKENELGLEEVGRRAIQIRELNKIRVSIKNEMVDKYKEGFKDVKMNHVSA